MIRLFDIFFSMVGIILLLPLFIFISLWIIIDSNGPIFYKQSRVGKNGKEFKLYKFRSMKTESDKKGLLTVGSLDPRITKAGAFIRKYKIDELPQLINVLEGTMSMVGPRPEVRKYVDLYTCEQKRVLSVKPGITDFASIEYSNENEILGKAADPEKMYITEIMPHKILLNMKYIQNRSLKSYFYIIGKTIGKIL